MFKRGYIIIFVLLAILFLYTGFFLQQDITGSLSRTYNSIVGLALVLFMLELILLKKDCRDTRKSLVKPFIVFWIVMLGFQTLLTSESLQRALITSYYVSVWPISYLFFYKISKNSVYTDQTISNSFLVLICAAIVLFSITAYASYLVFGFNGSIGNSYFLLCLFPWSLIIPNKKVRLITIITLSFFILVSIKRAPILALSAVIMVYIVIANRKQSFFTKIFSLVMTVFGGLLLFYYVDMNFMEGNIVERFSNLERGANTREEIREEVLDMYSRSSFSDKLIGHGYNSVVSTNPLELSAHNDYIETLYDHGLLVLLLQLTVISRLFYLSYKLYRLRSIYFPSLLSSILLYVIVAFATHMILYPYYFLFISSFWGYIEGKYVSNKL